MFEKIAEATKPKTSRYTLIQALSEIAQRTNVWAGDITMIEYEDGSGKKFNYSVKNGVKKFIAL